MLVADEYTCRHVVAEFNNTISASESEKGDLRAELAVGDPWEFPAFQIAVGAPSGGSYEQSRWFHLLEAAFESEIYGTAYIQTATMYGELIIRAMSERGFDFTDIPSGARPRYFHLSGDTYEGRGKTDHFWNKVYESVIDNIAAQQSLGGLDSESIASAADRLIGLVLIMPKDAPAKTIRRLIQIGVKRIYDGKEPSENAIKTAMDEWSKRDIRSDYIPAFEALKEHFSKETE